MPQRYRSRTDLLTLFAPNNIVPYTRDADRCFFGTAPALATINADYGEGTAEEWLVSQLAYVAEMAGCKTKLSQMQIEETAKMIASDYYYLSLSELMLFFRRFIGGRYGRFYGAVDPMTITSAIDTFVRHERNEAYSRRVQAEDDARRERERRMFYEANKIEK